VLHVRGRQRPEPYDRAPSSLDETGEGILAGCDHPRADHRQDRVGLEPTEREARRSQRGAVGPLRVVDDDDRRGGVVAEPGEELAAHFGHVVSGPNHRTQSVGWIPKAAEELAGNCEGFERLVLRTASFDRPTRAALRQKALDERGFADAGRALDHDHARPPVRRVFERRVQQRECILSTDEPSVARLAMNISRTHHDRTELGTSRGRRDPADRTVTAMRLVVDFDADGGGRPVGTVRVDERPEGQPFADWLELLRILESCIHDIESRTRPQGKS
jgi:hypothetical protein